MDSNANEGPRLRAAFLLIVLAAAFFLSLFKIDNYDIWWHLKTGEYVIGHRSVPRTDIFSVTAEGRRWVNPSWLADVLFYGVYRMGGLNGLILMKALAMMLCAFFLFRCMIVRKAAAHVACAVSVLALVCAQPRMFARPLIFTFLFLAVFVYLVERQLRDRSRMIYAAPILMVLWVNLHAGFVAGLMLLVLLAAAERSRRAAIVAALALAAAFINPFFYHALLYPVRLLHMEFMKQIQEWTPPDLAVKFLPFWCMAAVLCLCMLMSAARMRLLDGLVVFVFLALAVRHRRNIAVFALVCAPPLAVYFQEALNRIGSADRLKLRRARLAAAFLSAALVGVSFLLGVHRFGFGVREGLVPKKALDFVLAQHLSGPVFNEYEWGGYVIWRAFPECKVFMDGRCDVYNDELYREWWDIYYGLKGWDDALRKRGVRLLILSYDRAGREQAIEALGTKDVEPFYENKSWKVIYWDSMGMVCVRDVPENRDLISRFLCEASNPGTFWRVIGNNDLREKAAAEIERKIAEDPTCSIAYDNLGQIMMVRGELDDAIGAIEKCVKIDPNFAPARYHLGVCYYRKQDYEEAVACYKRAISLDPGNASYYHNLGDAYFRWARPTLAEREYRRALRLDPRMWLTRKNLAVCYEQMGCLDDAIQQLRILDQLVGGDESVRRKIKDLERKKAAL